MWLNGRDAYHVSKMSTHRRSEGCAWETPSVCVMSPRLTSRSTSESVAKLVMFVLFVFENDERDPNILLLSVRMPGLASAAC